MGTLSLDFDVGPTGHGARFSGPRLLFRADRLDQVKPCFEAMERARQQGFWLAGMMSYELGYGFSDRLSTLIPEERDVPLMLFGAYDEPEALAPDEVPFEGSLDLSPVVSRADYNAAFAKATDYIAAGDVYQINLTFPLTGQSPADPRVTSTMLVPV